MFQINFVERKTKIWIRCLWISFLCVLNGNESIQAITWDRRGLYHRLKRHWHTVYPKKYAHGFVVLCFAVVMQSFIMNSHGVFIHIHQGCFAGTGAIVRLPQCQWSKPDGYGKISQCITTTKHSKAKTVCIFLGINCSFLMYMSVSLTTSQFVKRQKCYFLPEASDWAWCYRKEDEGIPRSYILVATSRNHFGYQNNPVLICSKIYFDSLLTKQGHL